MAKLREQKHPYRQHRWINLSPGITFHCCGVCISTNPFQNLLNSYLGDAAGNRESGTFISFPKPVLTGNPKESVLIIWRIIGTVRLCLFLMEFWIVNIVRAFRVVVARSKVNSPPVGNISRNCLIRSAIDSVNQLYVEWWVTVPTVSFIAIYCKYGSEGGRRSYCRIYHLELRWIDRVDFQR